MILKKINGTLALTLGIIGFALTVGAMDSPAFGDTNSASIQTSNSTTQAAVTYTNNVSAIANKDYFININKSEVQNGIKVTVEKAVGTKKDLKVILKIESDKTLDKVAHNNSIFELTYGENNDDFASTSSNETKIDDKTAILTLDKYNDKGEYSAKGEMRVDIVLSKYKVNIGMDIPVDFSESFNNVMDKEISAKIPGMDYTFNKLEADALGTTITYTEPKKDNKNMNRQDYKNEKALWWNPAIILKVGDRFYKTHSRGGGYSDTNEGRTGNYEAKAATYDIVKNQKSISLIPVICNITQGELNTVYLKQNGNNKSDTNKDNISNVSYTKDFNFADGSKGEIYNIERTDNSIKVYCKGQSEKESLLMASNMTMHYQTSKEKPDGVYYDNNSVSFCKDPKEALGYIIEFDNVQKDKGAELSINSIINLADKYELCDEIKLLN